MTNKLYNTVAAVCLFQISISFTSCKPENEVSNGTQYEIDQIRTSMRDFTDKSVEYRTFPIEVSFFDESTELTNIQIAIQNRKAFIKLSGLPDDSNIDEFKKTKSIATAFALYNSHIERNYSSPYLKTFKQYGSWLILTRLDLLAKNTPNDLQMTYHLLKQFVDTKYEGFQLLGFGINHLVLNNFNRNQIKSLCADILQYAIKISVSKKEEPNSIKVKEPLPPEIQESVKKYTENKEHNRQKVITQLQNLIEQL